MTVHLYCHHTAMFNVGWHALGLGFSKCIYLGQEKWAEKNLTQITEQY